MSVKVPFKSLKFGAYQVEVKALSKEDSKSNWGLYWPFKYRMDLHAAYPNRQKAAEVFLHESMHVILEERGVKLPSKVEEQAVTEAAKGLIAFFRDNPEAARWFMKAIL